MVPGDADEEAAADGDRAAGLLLQKLPGDQGDEDGWARAGALFDTLVGARGRVLGKPALEEALFAFDAEIEGNAVEVYVSRLRRKLSTQDKGAPITTVRGVGYMFNAEVSRA